MKKVKMFFVLTVAVLTHSASAQTSVGGFLGYGSGIGQAGIGINAEFNLDDKWSISPGLLFYFPESNPNFRFSWMELNFNAHYYFYNEGVVGVYGLGGMNFARSHVREKFGSERYYTNGEVGLNMGIGSSFDVGKKFKPFAEMKFVLGTADQLALFFGLKYSL